MARIPPSDLARPTKSPWRLLVALLLVLPLMAACGSHDQLPFTPKPIHVGTELAKVQVLHREVQADPETLDPSLAQSVASFDVLEDFFEGLTTLAEDGTIVPGVASSWSTSADGKTWTFHLRDNARWSNGKPVTAADFVYGWRREVNPTTGSVYSDALAPIQNAVQIAEGKKPVDSLGVEAPNPHTLIVHLVHPTPYLTFLLANCYLFPLYEPAIKKWGASWTLPGHMVSNGAFELTGRVINGSITAVKNPYYWNASQVHLTKVIYYPISNVDSATDQYLAGSIDFTDEFNPTEKTMLQRALGSQVVIGPYFGTAFLSFNLTKPPFQNNPKLRLALSIAVDRKILVKYVQRGIGIPAYNIMPPLPSYKPEVPYWAKLSTKKRHALALKLYHEAGYSKAHPLQTILTYPSGGPQARQAMEALAAMWQMNLGAKIEIYNIQWKVFLQDLQLKQPTLFWSAWIGDFPDPFTFMQLYTTGFGMNYGNYSNSKFDSLVSQASEIQNVPERYKLFAQAGAILNQDMPYLPLSFYESVHLIKPYVKGWKQNVMDRNLSQYMYILAHN